MRTVSFREGISGYNPYLLTGFYSFLAVTATEELVSGVRPFGVDVASGVEDAPGIKCLGFIQNFQAEIFVFISETGIFLGCKSVGKTCASECPPKHVMHGFVRDPSPRDAKRLVNGKIGKR